ncbi:TAXI family TRAP transporter solute-binding subunit [Peribacillus asahii]|nr:TAXI family TRAP transporter solute-binding subunit [Peribacillus asahii]USK72462.1 TAXI family TRAP transporter solute-binding subunit [Peribacillus asahii]
MGVVYGPDIQSALNGLHDYKGKQDQYSVVKGIFSWPYAAVQLIVRADSGIDSIEDLKGKKIAIGAPGSTGATFVWPYVLPEFGITEENSEWQYLDQTAASEALGDGAIDVVTALSSARVGAIETLSLSRDIKMLDIPDPQREQAIEKSVGLVKAEQNPQLYGKHQKNEAPIQTIGHSATFVVHEDVPEDVVYNITKTLFDNLEDFHKSHASAKDITLEKAYTWGKTGEVPYENMEILAQYGLLGMTIDEEDGGQGNSLFEAILVIEEISKVYPHTADMFQVGNFGAIKQVSTYGSKELKERVLPPILAGKKLISIGMSEPNAGSATTDLQTTARIEGDKVILNGSKIFNTHGPLNSFYVVWVRFGKGVKSTGAILVDRDAPGFSRGKLERHMSGEEHCTLHFDNCIVPIEFYEKDWTEEPWIRGGYAAHFPPGIIISFGEWLHQPIGPIHWASTETADEWKFYMEGAIQSGERAAKEVLNIFT